MPVNWGLGREVGGPGVCLQEWQPQDEEQETGWPLRSGFPLQRRGKSAGVGSAEPEAWVGRHGKTGMPAPPGRGSFPHSAAQLEAALGETWHRWNALQ